MKKLAVKFVFDNLIGMNLKLITVGLVAVTGSLVYGGEHKLISEELLPADIKIERKTKVNFSSNFDMGEEMGGEMSMKGLNTMTERVTMTGSDQFQIDFLEESNVMEMDIPMMGKQKEESPANYLGVKLAGKRDDAAKWKLTLLEGELDPEMLAMKEKEINSVREHELEIFGDQPRSVGDTWSVDVSKIQGFGQAANFKGEPANAKFVEIIDHEGARCARIEIDLKAKGEAIEGAEHGQGVFQIKGKLTFLRDLDLKFDKAMNFDGIMSVEVPGFDLPMDSKFAFEMSSKEL